MATCILIERERERERERDKDGMASKKFGRNREGKAMG